MKLSKTMKLIKTVGMNITLPVLLYFGLVEKIQGLFNIYAVAVYTMSLAMLIVVVLDILTLSNGGKLPPFREDTITPRCFRRSLALYQIAMLSFYGEVLLVVLYVFIVFMIKFHSGLCNESSSGAEAQDSKRS